MNQISMILPPAGPIEQRAQRIRDLVGAARTCIIEIGRELIAAKGELPHGDWLPWLETEFGWSVRTADNYMNVAHKFASVANFDGLTIDATALYALASPDVPPAAREEAIGRAAKGERITKAEADKMVADATLAAVADAIEAERATVKREIAELTERIKAETSAEMDDAAQTLSDLQTAYEAAIERHNELQGKIDNPTEEIVIRLIARLTKKRPSKLTLVAIASALSRPIVFAGKQYQPAAEQQIAAMRQAKATADEQLGKLFDPKGPPVRWHRALMALRTINDLDPVADLFGARHDGFDHAFAIELPKALAWITDFAREMSKCHRTNTNKISASSSSRSNAG
jgi:hypothetical protein